MVDFKLIKETQLEYLYEYYPEQDHSKKAGIITYNKVTKDLKIAFLAETDYMETTTLEDLLKARAAMNEIVLEERKSPLTEEEWPTPTEGFSVAAYGVMAMRKIQEKIEQGEIPKHGISVWY
jgi:hypothetical protein